MVRLFILQLAISITCLTVVSAQERFDNSQMNWEKIHSCIGDSDIVIRMMMIQDSLSAKRQYQAIVYKKNYIHPSRVIMLEIPKICQSDKEHITEMLDSLSIWFTLSLSKEMEGISKIYCIPTGDLLTIPFEYGKTTEDSMLGDKYEFYRITSENEICNIRKYHNNIRMLICGGIDFRIPQLNKFTFKYRLFFRNCKLGRLKYSDLIIDNIEEYSEGKEISTLTGQNATETTLKKQMQDSINIIVIETHGLFLNNYNMASAQDKEDPMENHALALASASYTLEGGIVPDSIDDGILTAKEISELDLSNVDLAVISACKSALGEIREDGVYGLTRGFKQAGVKSLIMATDDIVDYVSGQLWIQLFRNLAKGMTKREALLQGLKYIRTMDDGAFSHPKYWTPFILIDGVE